MKRFTQKIKDFISAIILSVKQELESSDKAKKCACAYKIESINTQANASQNMLNPKKESSEKSKKDEDIDAYLESIAAARKAQGKRI